MGPVLARHAVQPLLALSLPAIGEVTRVQLHGCFSLAAAPPPPRRAFLNFRGGPATKALSYRFAVTNTFSALGATVLWNQGSTTSCSLGTLRRR